MVYGKVSFRLPKGDKLITQERVTGSLPEIIRNTANIYDGDLTAYFRVVFKAKNVLAPYHNFRHMFHVTFLCYEACIYYYSLEPWMNGRVRRNLLIAAMFHDFNHTGRTGNDDLNIELALRGLRENILEEDKDYLEDITMMIKGTQFPYVIPSGEMDLTSTILRDADASQALSSAWIQQIVFGLAAEMGITPLEALRRQEDFHRGLTFHSGWAKEKFGKVSIYEKIEEARALLSILEA